MDQAESIKILKDIRHDLESLSDEEVELLKKDMDNFISREESPEEHEENSLRRKFLICFN